MKVIVYIDGEHNTVEVKDKIKSVLPDANYMIFHPAENMGKVTEFDRIKEMNVDEMAEYHTTLIASHLMRFAKDLNLEGIFSEIEKQYCVNKWKEHLESEVETE